MGTVTLSELGIIFRIMEDKEEAQEDRVAQLVAGLIESKIPPPVKFSGDRGAISVGAFVVAFERLSKREYDIDSLSWIQGRSIWRGTPGKW